MSTPPSRRSRSRKPGGASDLIGTWRKQPGAAGAGPYPATLTIRPDGQYRGAADPPGEYAVWDVGTWSPTAPGEVAISTASDAVIRYRYALSGRHLRFTDPDGCMIDYLREATEAG